MLVARHIRDLDLSREPGFLAAASGLARIGNRLHVVADDALHLASFDLTGNEPGALFRLKKGRLPDEHAARKARKPDFEALVALPGSAKAPHGALMALGSGSRPNRRRGVIVHLDSMGIPARADAVDLTPLYDPLDQEFSETNIEGAVVADDALLLFQRASAASPVNAVIAYPLQAALAAITGKGTPPAPAITPVALPAIDGAVLSFTDAALLPGSGRSIVFSAVAEASANAYDDGPLRGSAIGLLDPDFRLLRSETLSPTLKVEGIVAEAFAGSIQLLMVTDADDASKPAGLWSAELTLT